jgi:hypothetical protein
MGSVLCAYVGTICGLTLDVETDSTVSLLHLSELSINGPLSKVSFRISIWNAYLESLPVLSIHVHLRRFYVEASSRELKVFACTM